MALAAQDLVDLEYVSSTLNSLLILNYYLSLSSSIARSLTVTRPLTLLKYMLMHNTDSYMYE
jgi:hypothetical protein